MGRKDLGGWGGRIRAPGKRGAGNPAPQIRLGPVLGTLLGAPLVWASFPWSKDILDFSGHAVEEVACTRPPGAVDRDFVLRFVFIKI